MEIGTIRDAGSAQVARVTGRARKLPLRMLLACLLLCLATLAFAGALGAGFIGFDDDRIVTENGSLKLGLSLRGIQWAFTNPVFGNWTPVAWLTHLFDVQVFGMDARGHHLTSLLWHLAAAWLLFTVAAAVTGSAWRSWLLAALFALHPLHVEPVVWIAARRDVVSAPFWFATIYAHYRFCATRSRWWYAAALFSLTAGLMGKSMLMTLPFVLLLLDYWPLGRIHAPKAAGGGGAGRRSGGRLAPLLVEKIPHAAIAVLFALIAGWQQRELGAVKSLEMYSAASRAGNALVSYVRYLAQTLVPHDLAVWYPFPENGWSPWLVAACGLFLVAATGAAIAGARGFPWFGVGWFWYLGTLVPVIGIVQLGGFAVADRFTYLPLVGIFIAVAWGLPDLSRLGRGSRTAAAAAAATILVCLLSFTRLQVARWQNGITLFEHTVVATSGNYLGHYNLAIYHERAGNVAEAMNHYREAILIRPNYSEAHNNLGALLLKRGQSPLAIPHLSEAVRVNADNVQAQLNLGMAYLNIRRPGDAVRHLEQAAARSPGNLEIKQLLQFARSTVPRTP